MNSQKDSQNRERVTTGDNERKAFSPLQKGQFFNDNKRAFERPPTGPSRERQTNLNIDLIKNQDDLNR